MSAEKCGALSLESLREIFSKMANTGGSPPELIIGTRAYHFLKKIRSKIPNYEPQTEAEIWFKARSLGIIEE